MIAEALGLEQEIAGIGRRPLVPQTVARPIGEGAVGHLETGHLLDGRFDVLFDSLGLPLVEPDQVLEVELGHGHG